MTCQSRNCRQQCSNGYLKCKGTCDSNTCKQKCPDGLICVAKCSHTAKECFQNASAHHNTIYCNASQICIQTNSNSSGSGLLSCNNSKKCTQECYNSEGDCKTICNAGVENCTQQCRYGKCQATCHSKRCDQQRFFGSNYVATCSHETEYCIQRGSRRDNTINCDASQLCSQTISDGNGLLSCNNSKNCTQKCFSSRTDYTECTRGCFRQPPRKCAWDCTDKLGNCKMICDVGVINCTQQGSYATCDAACNSKWCDQQFKRGWNNTIYCNTSQVCSQKIVAGNGLLSCNNSQKCTQECSYSGVDFVDCLRECSNVPERLRKCAWDCSDKLRNCKMVCNAGVETCTQKCNTGIFIAICDSKWCIQTCSGALHYLATCSNETKYCIQEGGGFNSAIYCDASEACSQKSLYGNGLLSCNNTRWCTQECHGLTGNCATICDSGVESCAQKCNLQKCDMSCNSPYCIQNASFSHWQSKFEASCGRQTKECVQIGVGKNSLFSCNASNKCSQHCMNKNCSSSCNHAEVCTQECSARNCATSCDSGVHNCTQESKSKTSQMTCNSKKCEQNCSVFVHCRAACGKDAEVCVQTGLGQNSQLYCDAAGECTQKCYSSNCLLSCNNTRWCVHECSSDSCKIMCAAEVEKCTQACYSENCQVLCNSKSCYQECHADGCNATCPVGVEECTQICNVDQCFFSCHAKKCKQIYKSGKLHITHYDTIVLNLFLFIYLNCFSCNVLN